MLYLIWTRLLVKKSIFNETHCPTFKLLLACYYIRSFYTVEITNKSCDRFLEFLKFILASNRWIWPKALTSSLLYMFKLSYACSVDGFQCSKTIYFTYLAGLKSKFNTAQDYKHQTIFSITCQVKRLVLPAMNFIRRNSATVRVI